MRPLRYSINVTLDGCVDHRAGIPDEELHQHYAASLAHPLGVAAAGVAALVVAADARPQDRR